MSSKAVKSNRFPEEVMKKPRKRRARVSKGKSEKKLRQKQKQKQVVNVQVSAGGGGSGGGYIPAPAPALDYMALANLLRPAAVANVPIREAPVVGALPAREAEAPALRERTDEPAIEMAMAKARKVRSDIGKPRKVKLPVSEMMSEREAGYETFPSSEGERETERMVRESERASIEAFRKYGGGGGAFI